MTAHKRKAAARNQANQDHAAPFTRRNENPQIEQTVGQLRDRRISAALAHDGKHCWIPNTRGELMRHPSDSTAPVPDEEIREVLGLPGVWVASYMRDPTAEHPANCFNYLCRDPKYGLEGLSKYGRRDVRRGLRSFSVRTISWEELLENGQQAYADTTERHGHERNPRKELEEAVARQKNIPYYELWGAWKEHLLAAWIKVIKIDAWAFITEAYSAGAFHRDCPNNAVVYEATRTFLNEENRRVVSYGISSIQATSNIASLHKFKVRLGFEPVPFCRTFALHWMLKPMLVPKAASWFWDTVSGVRPSSETLAKVAGLSRLVSGRETDPLAWARDLI